MLGRPVARDGMYVLGAQGIAMLIALVADRFLFRGLQLSERGTLATVLGMRTIMLYIADMGIQLMTVRVGAQYVAKGMLKEANAIFRRALVFRLLAAIGVAFLSVSLSELLCTQLLQASDRRLLVFSSAAALIGMTTVAWGLDVSQCRRRFGAYFAQYIAEAVLRAAAIVYVLHWMTGPASRSSEMVLWMMAAAVTLAAMISILIERAAFADAKGLGLAAPAKVGEDLRAFIPYATAATFLGMVGLYTELFLLQRLRGPEEAAVFEGARRLGSLLPLITAGIATVLLPRASALESLEQCREYIRKAVRWTVPLACIFSGGLALTAGIVVPLMWGDRYDASITPLRWICLAHALSFVATPLSFVLYPLKRPGLVVLLNGLNLALSLMFGWWLINTHGALGAAWSMLIVRSIVALATGLVIYSVANAVSNVECRVPNAAPGGETPAK